MTRRYIHPVTALLLFFSGFLNIYAQSAAERTIVSSADTVVEDSSDFVRASLMVIERNVNSPISYFGHIALRMQCPSAGMDYCFTFDTMESATLLDILCGTSCVGLLPAETPVFIEEYAKENRWVKEYPLNLTLAEKRRLWRKLDERIDQGASLRSDFFNRGCSQETAALVIASIEGDVSYGGAIEQVGNTRRKITLTELPENTWIRLSLFFLSGQDVDEEIYGDECLFLPYVLERAWADAYISPYEGEKRTMFCGAPVVYNQDVSAGDAVIREGCFLLSPVFLFSALFLLVFIVSIYEVICGKLCFLTTFCDALTLGVQTFSALVLLLMHTCSDLSAFNGWNWFFIPFNLIPLVVFFVMKFKGTHALSLRKRIYWGYTLVLTAFLIFMCLRLFELPLFILVGALDIRCIGKLVMTYKNQINKNI